MLGSGSEEGWLGGGGGGGGEVRFWRLSEGRSERGSMAIMFEPVLVRGPVVCGSWLYEIGEYIFWSKVVSEGWDAYRLVLLGINRTFLCRRLCWS